jgi:hypothetical protein
VKEAFNPADFVLGNLTTVTDDGNILQSAGMIFIDATSGNRQLTLDADSEIGFMVPSEELISGMEVFEGKSRDDFLTWEKPKPILNEELKTLEEGFKTIVYAYYGELTPVENVALRRWFWDEETRKVGDKYVTKGIDLEITAITEDKVYLKENASGLFTQEVITEKGRNGFVSDYNTNYIFSVKKLGWANLDRIYDKPNSEEVDFVVTTEGRNEFGYVFISLILPEDNIYIPGYERSDDGFSFGHNDQEKTVLPIGEEAIIMATAYKDDVPYIAFEKITISKSQTIEFELEETTAEGLKTKLETIL